MKREDIKEIQEKECTACSGSGYYCGSNCGACNGTGKEYDRDDVDAFKDTYIVELEHDLLKMSKALVRIDNTSLEESGYSFSCDTHDHDNCINCDVLKAKKHIKSMEVN